MKKCVLVLLLVIFYLKGQSQGLDEWISQKATQKKYLLQQIAALKVYIAYLGKGYDIAKKGLNTIGDIKSGHLNLDKDFFASLVNINPKVRKYAKVADIIAMNIKIVQSCKQTLKTTRQSDLMNNGETSYMNTVFSKLIEGCTDLTDELMTVISPGKFKMSDDERIKRIDEIYDSMQDRYVFVDNFGSEFKILSLQREQEIQGREIDKSIIFKLISKGI